MKNGKLMNTYKNGISIMISGAVLICMISLGGCVSVLPKPKDAPVVYRLSVPQGLSAANTVTGAVVNIEYPQAAKSIGGTDIVLSPDGRRLTIAANSRWAAPIPDQIQNILIDTLAKKPGITGVTPSASLRPAYRLNMDLRRFEAVFDNGEDMAPLAVVQINLSLTETRKRQLIASRIVKQQSRAGAKTVSAVVAAQDHATAAVVNEIVNWLEEALGRPDTAM